MHLFRIRNPRLAMSQGTVPAVDWVPHEVIIGDNPDRHTEGPTARRRCSYVPTSADEKRQRRSLSISLPWRRSRPSPLCLFNLQSLPPLLHDAAMDDSQDLDEIEGASHEEHVSGASSSLRGMLRRASLSFKGIVHRRPSQSNDEAVHEKQACPSRPTTSHATWNRLRQAASFRHARHVYGLNPHQDTVHTWQDAAAAAMPAPPPPSNLTIPAMGNEPPFIPSHTGAAAKASAVMQNEFFARKSMQKMRLHAPSSEDGNDRESGIGIVVTVPCIGLDDMADEAIPPQDASISRLDLISLLPTELALHVLAFLDASALAKASSVSRNWNRAIQNQHIWRESCLRETTATYSTGAPVPPGSGLGIPLAVPGKNWRRVYSARQELRRRWKRGKAQLMYLNGHLDSIYCHQFDEHKIITGSRDRTIRIWDMHSLECRLIIGPPEVVCNPGLLRDDEGNATHFASGLKNKWGFSTPSVVSFAEHHVASILCLQYDERILVTGSSDAGCIVYDVKAGYLPICRLQHHTAPVLDLVFDDKHIVTCSKDRTICVWNRETGSLVRQLCGHTGPVNAVQMRGNTIVSCSGDSRVKLWNIDTGKNIREFVGHTKGLACSQFSEDGRYLASAGNDRMIRIWDANTGECVREMKAHDNLVRSLHIDSVSGRLISASYDTDIKVWDMETGHLLVDFPRWHASWVLSAKSDYRRIISTGQVPKILIMDFGADVDGIELLESRCSDSEVDKGEFF